MKRVLFCLILSILYAACVLADGGECGTGLTWSYDEGVLEISGTGNMADFTIGGRPWESRKDMITKAVIGAGVTHIGANSFLSCGSLAEVTLPAGLVSIGESAFTYCRALSSLTLPEGLQSIGRGAFAQAGLHEITIPDTVASIGAMAFLNCASLQSIGLPSGITEVTQEMLRDCYALQSVEIPAGVTAIAYEAFYNCRTLSSVTLPAGLTSVADMAFSSCGSLSEVTFGGTAAQANAIEIGNSNTMLTGATWHCSDGTMIGLGPVSGSFGDGFTWELNPGTGELTISGEGAMPDFEYGEKPWEQRRDNITKAVIGAGVTHIGANSFLSCGSLAEVTLPAGLVSIGESAFTYCRALSSLTLPEGLQSIGRGAFAQAGLHEITIPDTVASIGAMAFLNCASLQSIGLPSGITEVTQEMLRDCYALQSVEIPAGVTAIAYEAFYNCRTLSSVTLPAGLTSVADMAFSSCGSLSEVTFGGTAAQANAIEIGNSNTMLTGATWHCSDGTMIGLGPVSGGCGTSVSWDLEGTVLTVSGMGDMAGYPDVEDAPWMERRPILTKIVISAGVTGVGENAFYGCPQLTAVELPEGLTSIGVGAFADCKSLTEVTIPESVLVIGADAFSGCGLTELHLMKTDLTEEGAVEYCPAPEGCAVHLYSKVTFDANGGAGAPVTLTVERNTEFDVPVGCFSRDYCRLRSWNTRSDGKGDSYPADTLQVSWNTTLYAQWDSYLFYSLEVYDLLNDEPMVGGVIHIAAVMDDGSGESTVPIYDDCDSQANYSAAGHVMLNLTAEAAEGFQFWGWYEAEPTGDVYSQLTRPTKRLSEEAEFAAELHAEDGIVGYYIAAYIPAFGVPNFVLPEIGADAFRSSAASSAYVPDGVTYLAARSFADCKELRQIRLPENCEVDESAFEGCGKIAVYTKSGGTTANSLEGQENIFVVVE